MYRKVFVAEHPNDLTVQLPENYLHKGVEVIAFEVDNTAYNAMEEKRNAAQEAVAYFQKIAVDMSGFKFNREEANER